MDETAEFDSEETIASIENVLSTHGFITERIGNIYELTTALHHGKRWDLVFNICEGLYGTARESAVPALLDQYQIPYVFSDPAVLSITLNKHLTCELVHSAGGNATKGFIIKQTADLKNINLPFPLFVKPLREGTGKGITSKCIIHNKIQLYEIVNELTCSYNQPVRVEEYLPGREFTAGIIGNGSDASVIGVMEIDLKTSNTYSYDIKENYLQHVRYKPIKGILRDQCAETALFAWKTLGCNDAGRIDLRINKHNQVCFMEVNPLAGLHPVHSDLPILAKMHGISYDTLIMQIIEQCFNRLNIEYSWKAKVIV